MSLLNVQVGTKVAAASRKTNTTTHEVLGVLTKGDTQVVSSLFFFFLLLLNTNHLWIERDIEYCLCETTLQCFFDTPGLMLKKSGYGYKDIKARVQNAWTSVDLFDVLIVMFDVHRHLTW